MKRATWLPRAARFFGEHQSGGTKCARVVGKEVRMAIRNLETHPSRYVSVHELMEYWGLSRYELYKQIEAGTLPAVRLGPRLYRIQATEALKFQHAANLVVNEDYVRPVGGV